jgi:dihydroorotase (multifunctional complex type)
MPASISGRSFGGRNYRLADLAVRGGLVHLPDGPRIADLLVSSGLVEAVLEPGAGQADLDIDAADLWVLPGAVDAHVHSRDPGYPDKEDWGSLTAAAAAGGVTTVADMPNTLPSVDTAGVLEKKASIAASKAVVDFALWGIARSSTTPEQVRGLISAGAVGLKAYLGYAVRKSNGQVLYAPGAEDSELETPPSVEGLAPVGAELARLGRPLAAHAEDPEILRRNARTVVTYADLLASRPAEAEVQAIQDLGGLSARLGLEVRIVHLSSAAGLRAAVAARARRARLSLETCPQYLWLSDREAERLGPVAKMFPLIRTVSDRAALRAALLAGVIESVGTDHAPHTDAEKLGRSWEDAAAGSPGVQTLYLSCLELALKVGRPELAVRWACENPARALGLYPGKGSLQQGADADLVLVDPKQSTEIAADSMLSRQRHGVFEGRRFGFAIRAVYLRGLPVGRQPGRLVKPARP